MTDDDDIPLDAAHRDDPKRVSPRPRKDARLLETGGTHDWCGCTGGDETKWRSP